MPSIKKMPTFENILSIKDDIDKTLLSISGDEIAVFEDVSLLNPNVDISIHGFYTTITWLYVQYFEAGKLIITFLEERATSLGLNSENHLSQHMNIVHCFRTFLQHNMDLGSPRNLAKKKSCISWICKTLGRPEKIDETFWPSKGKQWDTILEKLLEDSLIFFRILQETLNQISTDEFVTDTIEVLKERVKRCYPPNRFDSIISIVSLDMGLSHIDPVALRKRHFDKWNKHLQLLGSAFSFDHECRRLVENTLINDENIPLPITGKDIMDEFNLPPGKEIRELLKIAREKFNQTPCSRATLLAELIESF